MVIVIIIASIALSALALSIFLVRKRSSDYSSYPPMTLSELSKVKGENALIYIACNGLVFDVSENPMYQG